MRKWGPLALLFAHALAIAQDGDTGTVSILGSRRRLRLHGMPRRRPQSTPEASKPRGGEAASSSDDMQQPSSELEDDDSTSGGQGSLQQDGALGDPSGGEDTEMPPDEWEHDPSSDFHDG